MDFMLNSFKFIDLFCTKFADVFSPLWTMFKGIFCKSGKQFELNGFHQKQNAVAHWFFTRNIFSVYFFRIEESLVSPAQRDQNEMQLNLWLQIPSFPGGHMIQKPSWMFDCQLIEGFGPRVSVACTGGAASDLRRIAFVRQIPTFPTQQICSCYPVQTFVPFLFLRWHWIWSSSYEGLQEGRTLGWERLSTSSKGRWACCDGGFYQAHRW